MAGTETRSSTPPTTPPSITAVDERGIAFRGGDDLVLDVLFDGRRIWSFWTERDSEPEAEEKGARFVVWPRPLARFLDGEVRLTVRSHVAGEDLYDREQRFGTSTERIRVVNDRGVELGIDMSGRMQMTFETRTADHVGPLLDSLQIVLDALRAAGVEAFPAYGTLLGAVRDGALIGHDSDADVGYVSRHTEPVDVARESFALQRRLADDGFEVVRYSGAGFKVIIRESDGNSRGLDVFTGFFDGAGHLILMGEIRAPFEPEWIFPLGTTTLEGRTLPAPAAPEHLLAAAYGPSWRTPDPAFQYSTPASTTTRLNDWFRGTNVGRADWDRRYQSARRHAPATRPDPMARFVWREEEAHSPALLVDLGCGRGGNARWFARRGVATLGLDFSPRAFEYVDERRGDLPLEFANANLLEMRHVLAYGARVGAVRGRKVVVARHLVDALTGQGQENLWRFLQLACSGGGRAYLDFLVTPAEGDRWAQRQMLRPVKAELVARALRARGGTVVSRDIIGSGRIGVPRPGDLPAPEDRDPTPVDDTPAADVPDDVGPDDAWFTRRACRMVVEWA